MPIRTAVIDDDAVIRQLLQIMLETAPDLEFVGGYANAESALKSLPGSLPPHVVLVDVGLPGISGVECVEKMMHWPLPPQVVMLTSSDNDETILKCVAAGACGYLLKPVQTHLVVSAVREAAAGGAPLSAKVAKTMVELLRRHRPSQEATLMKDLPELSQQENRVLHQIVQGCLYKEIADALHLSEGTVRTYVQRIYRKLGVHSRSQAVAKVAGIQQEHESPGIVNER